MKILSILAPVLVANAQAGSEGKHPVRDEIVSEIRQKTSKWTPMDPKANPLSRIPAHRVKASLGLLGDESS